MTDDQNDDSIYFEAGDQVRTAQNPHLTGQVVGEREWGQEYQVRLADGLTLTWFKYYEIEHDFVDEEEVSNVISLAEAKAARKAYH